MSIEKTHKCPTCRIKLRPRDYAIGWCVICGNEYPKRMLNNYFKHHKYSEICLDL